MSRAVPRKLEQKADVVDALRDHATEIGRAPSRSEFLARFQTSEYRILKHFPSWREAIRASGLEPNLTNVRLDDEVLLEDWGDLVRRHRHIPTREQYRREGKFSPGSFEKHFGPWSMIPAKFTIFATDRPEWSDVVALLPVSAPSMVARKTRTPINLSERADSADGMAIHHRHTKLDGIPTYGNPIDFRGLRHEPVNEQGVVFLFGMVAKELGYMVEAVQTGYPDCEAKRQIGPGKWQRVRVEFEFESRNFRDHGHPVDGCDVIVCWRHNWSDCPENLEVLELMSVIRNLASTDDV